MSMRSPSGTEPSSAPASPSLYQTHAATPPSTPHELLDYVAFLENELEHMKLDTLALQNKHHDEKIRLKERLEAALDKIDDAERELHAHKTSSAQSHASVECLKDDFRHTERLLQEERKKEKSLKDRIQKLELELEMKNDLINHRRKRDERARRQLEKENEILKKKATLGWMLGCLSEVYLQSEPEAAAAPLLKLVRNIQRELERENVVLSYSNEPPQMHLEYVEKEIRRLIDCARVAADSGVNQASLVKQSSSSTQKAEGDSPGGSCAKLTVCDSGDIQKPNFSNGVACRSQENHSTNLRVPEEGGSPSARYIINCFGGDTIRNSRELENGGIAYDDNDDDELNAAAGSQLGHHNANGYTSSQAQIEMFEANPEADVEHTRLSGSTWAELKVMNKQGAEAAEMRHCQADIKRMLSRLETSMQYLLKNQQVQPQQQGPPAPEARDRSIDDIILSAAHAHKTKSKTDKPAAARKHKVTAPTSKHKAPASATKHREAAVAVSSSRLKPKKQH